ncbi:sulfite exporter TauE/SafE family protein [bacterium]|nr:sulfite exporter TauE/SafE family protein [bacterium]
MELFAGFFLGVLGSFHCAGMCGPLVLALPHGTQTRWAILIEGLMYNAGKTLTYAMMGLVAGGLGATIRLAGYQQILSVVVGSLLLIVIVLPKRFYESFLFPSGRNGGFQQFKNFFRLLWKRPSYGSFFIIGLLNGFLPCGLVYMALAGAIVTAGAWNGFVYMAFFGLGTLPMLMIIYAARQTIGVNLRRKLVRLIPVGMAVVAILLILRGLSLGIPYVSPKTPVETTSHTPSCCE